MKIIGPLTKYVWGAGGLWAVYGQLDVIEAQPIWIVRAIGGLYQQFAQPLWTELMGLAGIGLSDHALLFIFTFVFSFPLFLPIKDYLVDHFGEASDITARGTLIIWIMRVLLGAVVLLDWALVAIRGAGAGG